MNLTPAQKRALLWLPADGSWSTERPPGRLKSSINSLWGYPRKLIEGQSSGLDVWWFRLTPAGIAARKAIEGEVK